MIRRLLERILPAVNQGHAHRRRPDPVPVIRSPIPIQAEGFRAIYYAFRKLEHEPAALRAEMQRLLAEYCERGA